MINKSKLGQCRTHSSLLHNKSYPIEHSNMRYLSFIKSRRGRIFFFLHVTCIDNHMLGLFYEDFQIVTSATLILLLIRKGIQISLSSFITWKQIFLRLSILVLKYMHNFFLDDLFWMIVPFSFKYCNSGIGVFIFRCRFLTLILKLAYYNKCVCLFSLFVCLFGVQVPIDNFSLIWKRHHCR